MPRREQHLEPVDVGHGDVDEDVAVVRAPSGRALVVPRSLSRLRGEQADVVADLQSAAQVVHQAQADLEQLVLEARELGVSWNAIGWSVGVSGEAVRQRYGGD